MSDLARFALTIGAAALVAGCAGPQLPVQTYGGQSRLPVSPRMNQRLIYVAGIYPTSVSVYSWRGRLLRTLQLSYSPRGICTDTNGNLYVADAAQSRIAEYAGDGSHIRNLKDPGQKPVACAVDPKTGNLAVTNSETTSSGGGNVAIYFKAQGTAKLYTNPTLTFASSCGYDNKGNLFVDGDEGQRSPGAVWFGELAAGQSSLLQIKVNGAIEEPGQVQWVDPYVTIGALYFNTIYRLAVSGKTAKVEGRTKLKGHEVVNSWIQGTKVIGGTIIFTSVPGKVEVWNYPAGGEPIKGFGNAEFTNAVTVGVAPPHS